MYYVGWKIEGGTWHCLIWSIEWNQWVYLFDYSSQWKIIMQQIFIENRLIKLFLEIGIVLIC